MHKSVIQGYINNFRRRIARSLRPGIGLKCWTYPDPTGGAVLVFQFGTDIENDDVYNPPMPKFRVLSELKQNGFGGNLEGVRFQGTNTIMERERIILIKDDSNSVWGDSAAREDVARIIRGRNA